jgi:hypothetical protein
MTKKIFTVSIGLAAALIIGGIAVAGGGGMGGSMGGGYQGMMGGGHMMQYNPNMSNPWQGQPQQTPYPSYQSKQTERQQLKEDIRQKRQELSSLYRSENPDKDLIDQKIEELSKLEAELDQ